LSRGNPAPAAPLALALLDRAMPRRTRRADHGVLGMRRAILLALAGAGIVVAVLAASNQARSVEAADVRACRRLGTVVSRAS
jgi:hypothetical protein